MLFRSALQNYINLILQDEVFLTSVKNTFVIAVITGPVGYILSFVFAWFINELPKWLRAVAVVIFYAPSIAGNAYSLFSIIFRGDAYGYLNSILLNLGFIDAPLLWLTDPRYIMPVLIFVILWMSMGTGFLSLSLASRASTRACTRPAMWTVCAIVGRSCTTSPCPA